MSARVRGGKWCPARRRLGLAKLLLMALAGCTTISTTVGRLTDSDKEYYQTFEGFYIDKVEKRQDQPADPKLAEAKGVALQARLSQGVVEAPELERYLNGILDRLKAVSPRPNYRAHVYVTPQLEFAAQATPDGAIFLSLGAINAAETEDDLAALLGHELAHLILDHHDLNALDRLTRYAVGFGVMAERLMQGPGQVLTGGIDASNSTSATIIQYAAENLLTPTFTRQQEDEADLLGTDLVVRARYSRERVATMMERMAKAETAAGKAKEELQLRQRAMRALKQQPAAGPGSSGPGSSGRGSSGRGSIGQALGQALDDLDQSLSESLHGVKEQHRPPEARLDSLQGYLNDRYAETELIAPDKTTLASVKAERQTRTILAAYAQAEEAYAKSKAGDAKRAQQLIRQALGGPAANHALPRWYAYNIDKDRGRESEGIGHLKVAVAAPHPPLRFYRELIEWHAGKQRFAEAMRFAQEAAQRFADPPELWPDLIFLNKALNRRLDATELLLRCRTEAPAELLERCVEAERGNYLRSAEARF